MIERRGTRVGHRYELLGHTISGRVAIEPYLVTLTEESEVFPLFQHAGIEFIHLLEGEVVYRAAGTTYRLGPATPCSSTATSRTARRSWCGSRSACWRSSRAGRRALSRTTGLPEQPGSDPRAPGGAGALGEVEGR